MKIKNILFLIIGVFILGTSKVNAANTNMCVYKGVTLGKGMNDVFDAYRMTKDIKSLIDGGSNTSFNMKIIPNQSASGYMFDIKFSNHQIMNILNKAPDIAGTSNNLMSLDYTDSWRIQKLDTSVPIKYAGQSSLNMLNFGECPKKVYMKLHYEAYEIAGLAVGIGTGAGAGLVAGTTAAALFCAAAPDPATCAVLLGVMGTGTGAVGGGVIGYKEGEKAKKWVIDEFSFFDEIGEFNFLTLFPGAFDLITDAHLVIGTLQSSRFTLDSKYNNFNADVCLSADDVSYYNRMFNDIIYYAKNTSYVTLYKNNKFEYIARIISKKYAKGGECYNANPGLQKNYEDLANNAKKVLQIFDGASNSNETYKNECQYILGDPTKKGSFAYYLDITFRFIKFLAPLLLIVLSIIDYVKVIASADADAVKKTNKKTVIRLIFALLLFFIPIIISTILTMLGVQGKCDFPNISGI